MNKELNNLKKTIIGMKEIPQSEQVFAGANLIISDNQNFNCQQCGISCKRIASLNQHIVLAHTNEKNHFCNICGNKFKRIQNFDITLFIVPIMHSSIPVHDNRLLPLHT